jgi:hypothetical protein
MQESLLSSFKPIRTIFGIFRGSSQEPRALYLTRKVDESLRLGRTAVLHSITVFVTFGTIATFCIAARAQTVTYHLHKEASAINTSFDQLKTSGPDAAITALTTVLTSKAAGDYLIKEFETQTGVPNASGVIQSGSNFSFSLYMRKTANVTGVTVKPEAKLKLNSATGTNVCSAIGSTALTTTVTLMNFSCSTTANISMAASDRFYLWVGVNISASSSGAYSGELDIEGTANGNFDSHVTITLPIGPPTISNVAPSGAAIGTAVVITGTAFGSAQGSSTVTFNGVPSAPSSWSPTSITTQVPTGATSGPIVVTINGQSSVGTAFTVLPGIAGLSPNSGVSGSSITITGTNFGAAQGSVTFNGTAAAITSWADKTIVAKVPVGATTGNVVVTSAASAKSAGASFTVFNPGTGVTITSLSAIAGAPGSSLTISGVNFGAAPGTVSFNGTATTVTSWSTGNIVATVPTGASTGNVVVSVNGQTSNGLRFIVTNIAGLAVDQIVSGHAALPPPLSTTSGNELLLAFVASGTGSTSVNTFTVSGLTWTLLKRTNTQKGTAEIWRAFAPFILNNFAAPAGTPFPAHASVTLISYLGVDRSGTNGLGAVGVTGINNASSGAPSVTLTSTRANSFAFGVGDDPSGAVARTVGTNQTMVDQFVDGSADTLWVQRVTGSIANSGTSVTLNDTAPTNHAYNLSAVEILPSPVPVITGLSLPGGPIGTAVTISGFNFGTTQGSSTVTFGGVPATATWSSTSIVATVPNGVPLGPVPVVVTTETGASNGVAFTVTAPLGITATVSSPILPTNNWYRSDVTISYQCSGGVAPLQCPPQQTITTEGFDQQIVGTVTDAAGQNASVTTHLSIDKTLPLISAAVFPSPNAGGWNTSVTDVFFNCSDSLSGIDTCPARQTLSQEGSNRVITGTATDLAGNTATATVNVNIETTPPSITATATPTSNAAGWVDRDVTVMFTCGTSISGGVQCPSAQVVSSEGASQVISGTVNDVAGNTKTTFVTVNIDKTPPTLNITSPISGTVVSGSLLPLFGTVSDSLSGVSAVTCNGTAAAVSGTLFSCDLSLAVGANSISVQATDVAGNTSSSSLTVTFVSGPNVTITSPTSLQLFGANPITITGTIDDPQATVSANGVNGTVSGNTFTISGVNLHETKNLLTVMATNAAGGTSTATVTVFLDTTPPQVHIDSPRDGAVVNTSQLTVMGNVNDLVSGTVNGDQVSVSVNGITANVSNRSFAAQSILLVPGQNTIMAIAKDKAGNISQHKIQVNFRDATAAQHLLVLSGNNQGGVINTVLPQPLVVQAVDGLGRPIVNRALTFQVSRSDGTMTAAVQSGRNLTVVTDGNGQASVKFQLGSRSGVGINQVAVTAPGFVGDTVFYATSTAAAPSLIRTVSGEIQRGAISSALAEPLVVIVMDAGGNPVANVPVTFQVNAGNGTIDGGNSAVKTTDLDGKAFALLTIGQQQGSNNNTVSATFPGNAGLPARFVASGVITGPTAATTISGIVLDNANQPVPNARASIKGSQAFAFTNAQGQFTIPGAPVGDVMLYVDGTFSTRPERFPTLSFQLTSLPGIDNALPGPIYLPPIDSDNTQMIDNNSDQDVVLTVKGMPGVQYTVFAHSATFPDGSKSGSLSLSQVHVDRVPMTPANGTAPSFVTTLQPPGVSFDPPVQMQVPNTSGLPPGQVAEVFSYRHDLEQFVSEGTGRVSEDGSVITTDPGFGLHVSGWNLIPPPPVAPNTNCSCSGSPNGPMSRQAGLLVQSMPSLGSTIAQATPGSGCSVRQPPTVTIGSLKNIINPNLTVNTPGVAKGGTVHVTVTLDPSPSDVPVTLDLSTLAGTGDAIFDPLNPGANLTDLHSLDISETSDILIDGLTQSSAANNIQLEAKEQGFLLPSQGPQLASLDFSVVWVTIALGPGPQVSPNNLVFAKNYSLANGTLDLGPIIVPQNVAPTFFGCRTGIEMVGTVSPTDYRGTVVLRRTVLGEASYVGSSLAHSEVAHDDTSLGAFRDDDPQAGTPGTVYDVDAPGTVNKNMFALTIRQRITFSEYAVLDSADNSQPASDSFPWFSVVSCKALLQGPQFVTDVPGDNKAASGSSPLSWNLK